MNQSVPQPIRAAAIANLVSQVPPLAGDGTDEYPVDPQGTIRVRAVNLDRLVVAVLDAAAAELYALAKTTEAPAVHIVGSHITADEAARAAHELRRLSIEAAADHVRISPRAEVLP